MTKYPIPEAVLRHHSAVLGKTGSGKTSTAKLMVEQAVAEGARVCVLDAIKSDWWGMISSADGKRPGLPFRILGGPHGHVPLHAGAGKAIGELVARGELPLSIVDMADFEAGGLQRFFVDFAPALLRNMRGVLTLVLEEAHEFAPKERAGIGNENMAIHYAKKLATAGRSKGIRLIVATQRTQALHNALLGSCESMVAHRMTAPADQAPVLKWLEANAGKATAKEIGETLAGLPTGTGWLCSGEAGIFERVEFPRISTFDNSATPTGDEAEREVAAEPVDADALRDIIGEAVREAEASDPKRLRKRIAEQDRRIGELERTIEAHAGNVVDGKRLQEVRKEGYDDGYRDGFADGRREMVAARDRLLGHLEDAIGIVEDFKAPEAPEVAPPPLRRQEPAAAPPRAAAPRQAPEVAAGLSRPQQRILDALAWLLALGIAHRASRAQVAFLAGYKPKGGAFNNLLGSLRSAGMIEYPAGGEVELTAQGLAAANRPDAPPTTADLQAAIMDRLTGPQRRILQPLIDAYPQEMGKPELAAAAGYEAGGGAFNNTVGSLRSLGLVDYPTPGFVVALPVLFIGGEHAR